jgi:hypothetical protein
MGGQAAEGRVRAQRLVQRQLLGQLARGFNRLGQCIGEEEEGGRRILATMLHEKCRLRQWRLHRTSSAVLVPRRQRYLAV